MHDGDKMFFNLVVLSTFNMLWRLHAAAQLKSYMTTSWFIVTCICPVSFSLDINNTW